MRPTPRLATTVDISANNAPPSLHVFGPVLQLAGGCVNARSHKVVSVRAPLAALPFSSWKAGCCS